MNAIIRVAYQDGNEKGNLNVEGCNHPRRKRAAYERFCGRLPSPIIGLFPNRRRVVVYVLSGGG